MIYSTGNKSREYYRSKIQIFVIIASLPLATSHDNKPVSFSHTSPPPKRKIPQNLKFNHY